MCVCWGEGTVTHDCTVAEMQGGEASQRFVLTSTGIGLLLVKTAAHPEDFINQITSVSCVASVPKCLRSWRVFSALSHLPRGPWRPSEDGRVEAGGTWIPVSPPGRLPAKRSHWIAKQVKNKLLLGEATEIWGFLSYCCDYLNFQRNNVF